MDINQKIINEIKLGNDNMYALSKKTGYNWNTIKIKCLEMQNKGILDIKEKNLKGRKINQLVIKNE